MQQYIVTGMSCAACSARVEKAVSAVPGVTACSVSLLTNSMGVEGTASENEIISAVVDAGYGARLKGKEQQTSVSDAAASGLEDTQTPLLRKRLLVSLGFLLVLMYISMGHSMFSLPVPAFLENPVSNAIAQLLLAAAVMVINSRFFTSGLKGALHSAPNMDTLVALGSSASFIYSVYALFKMTSALAKGGITAAGEYTGELYFESAAMILTLITVGKLLEAKSKGKTTNALKSLMSIAPKTATIILDGEEKTVPVSDVRPGDIFAVRPGESIPVDGTVIGGNASVNEASLTGESIPVDKVPGDSVSAGTQNMDGFITCSASRVGEDTTLSQIIRMVSDAAATKAPAQRIADRVSGVFVPAVISIALLVTAIWLLCGESFGFALARGISVLVISCPCALGLATPVAIMVGNGVGAGNGILFKTASALEETGKVSTVILDKTGTVTTGLPVVTDVIPCEGVQVSELLSAAASLEAGSEHPLAKAVNLYAADNGIELSPVKYFKALPGNGVRGELNGKMHFGGNLCFISSNAPVPEEITAASQALADSGKTPLFFCEKGRLLGIISVADTLKPDSVEAVTQLHNQGIYVVMLTGDNARTANAIGSAAGVDEIIADVLPADKERAVRRFKLKGRVAMVGDGINDAPALTRADIGIAIGAGADVAIDAADVVLMKSQLLDVPASIRLSRATYRNIRQNLFWAFFYNAICIPVAAGALIRPLGIQLNPMIAAAAMSISSFTVVSNALRLNLVKVRDSSKDKKIKHKQKEIATMERTMKIEGMMCPHCEARVKKALEALDGVLSADVSHEKGTAVVTATAISDAALTETVTAAGYEVLGIE